MKTSWIILAIIAALVVGSIFLIQSQKTVPQQTTTTTTSTQTPTRTTTATAAVTTTTTVAQPQTYGVELKNFAFNPSELTIKKGDTVNWTNKDSAAHTVTSDSGGELNSPTLSTGESYSHTFNQLGTFSYYCSPHPFMKGKVVVE